MRTLKTHLISKTADNRLHGVSKPIIGLTGGIATGKSTVTKELKKNGFEVIDADQLVKSIYQTDEAKEFILSNWPEAIQNNEIIFSKLREIFFRNPTAKEAIEKFIYARLPKVFQNATKDSKQQFIIYDVPLLFEKKLDQLTDLNVVVYSPRELQLKRVMKRDGIDMKLASEILNHQESIEEKKRKADFVINNSGDEKELAAEVRDFLLQVLD